MENRIVLIGRLGKEPEIQEKSGGHKLMRLSLATDDNYKDANGQWVNGTDWHNITIWNKQAEYVAKYASKGSILMVIGSNKTRKWTDQNGNDRYDYHVKPNTVKVLNPKKGEMRDEAPPQYHSGPGHQPEDDLPF